MSSQRQATVPARLVEYILRFFSVIIVREFRHFSSKYKILRFAQNDIGHFRMTVNNEGTGVYTY